MKTWSGSLLPAYMCTCSESSQLGTPQFSIANVFKLVWNYYYFIWYYCIFLSYKHYNINIHIAIYTLVVAIALCWRRWHILHIHHFRYIYTTLLKMASISIYIIWIMVTWCILCIYVRPSNLGRQKFAAHIRGIHRITTIYILHMYLHTVSWQDGGNYWELMYAVSSFLCLSHCPYSSARVLWGYSVVLIDVQNLCVALFVDSKLKFALLILNGNKPTFSGVSLSANWTELQIVQLHLCIV